MKRFILAATTIVALGAPIAAPAFADPPRSHRSADRDDRRGPGRTVVVVKKETYWQTGDRIDRDNRRYREVDYRAHRLKEPPRGYRYVRDDNTGEIVLAAIATGVIAALIFN